MKLNLGAAGRKHGRVRNLAGKSRAQMTGRVPPLRGRGGSRGRHPTGTPRSAATRVGNAFGRQAGHTAAGFANNVGGAYKATRTGPSLAHRAAGAKGVKYAAAGAGGVVAAKAGYGIVKAHAGRPQQNTQVQVVVAGPPARNRHRGLLHGGGRHYRRDRRGRFR